MEKYCTSLEVSKKLEKAGWKKETKFYHCSGLAQDKVKSIGDEICYMCSMSSFLPPKCPLAIPAPLSAEILAEMSNEILLSYPKRQFFDVVKLCDMFRSSDALAECWIWAKENGLIKEEK